jgi:hypothetical protein
MPPILDSEHIDGHVHVLDTSRDREQLTTSALALAAADSPAARVALDRFLRDEAFLARLDALEEPQLKLANLRQVLRALAEHPSESSGRLCESLATDPAFLADPDRMIFLLPALAAVRPMSEAAATIFRAANTEGYFYGNGPLLAANGSPRALALFEEMVANDNEPPDDRVDMVHRAVLAQKIHPPLFASCSRLLGSGLDPSVRSAIIETLFDHREDDWFGVERFAPTAPAWSEADTELLQAYLQLGFELTSIRQDSEAILQTVERGLEEIRHTLAERWK